MFLGGNASCFANQKNDHWSYNQVLNLLTINQHYRRTQISFGKCGEWYRIYIYPAELGVKN